MLITPEEIVTPVPAEYDPQPVQLETLIVEKVGLSEVPRF
jgi:hypothetical protein